MSNPHWTIQKVQGLSQIFPCIREMLQNAYVHKVLSNPIPFFLPPLLSWLSLGLPAACTGHGGTANGSYTVMTPVSLLGQLKSCLIEKVLGILIRHPR